MSLSSSRRSELRKLPQVDRLAGALSPAEPAAMRVAAARKALSEAADAIRLGKDAPSFEELSQSAGRHLATGRKRLIEVVNATGVLLHTNLGRAPLGDEQLAAIYTASRYSNLEFDLETGQRGSRYDQARDLLTALTGAEDALVVNNNAAAVLLGLATTSRGREVIISRGELIEIGGEFRIPDVMRESGAIMREVGTTNRTHTRDYVEAIGPQTAAIMKVHPSNYQVVGFVTTVKSKDLAQLAKERGLMMINDVGSGLITDRIGGRQIPWLANEPTVIEAVAEGAAIVTCSGDKLLGGPQCGIIVGSSEALVPMRRSPLLRAFRVDKTTLLALEATLLQHLDGRADRIPLWQMALLTPADLEPRVDAIIEAVDGSIRLKTVDGSSTLGGGSAPGSRIPTLLIEVEVPGVSPQELMTTLQRNDPPVVCRVANDRLVIDLRTVASDQDRHIVAALRSSY